MLPYNLTAPGQAEMVVKHALSVCDETLTILVGRLAGYAG